MNKPNMINVGTAERPVLVPEFTVDNSNPAELSEFWQMVANGSVDLGSDEALAKLLELRKQNEEKNGIK